jgi:transcriptional regulator with XRE-family HTH domain
METLAQLLKKARENKGWSQTQLANQLGRTRPLIAQWELNLLEPNEEDAEKLSKLLDIDNQTLFYHIEVSRFQRRFLNLVKNFPRLNASTIKQIVEQISFETVWRYPKLEKQLNSTNERERVNAFQQLRDVATFLGNLINTQTSKKIPRYTVRVRGAMRTDTNIAQAGLSIPVHGTSIALQIENGPAIERPTPTSKPRFIIQLHAFGEDFSIYENHRILVAVENEKMRLELSPITPEVTSHELKVDIDVPLSGIEVPSGQIPLEVIDLQFLVNEEGAYS